MAALNPGTGHPHCAASELPSLPWMDGEALFPSTGGFRHLTCQLDPIGDGMAKEQQGPAPGWQHRSLRAALSISIGLQRVADLALIFPVSLLSSRTSAAEKEMGGE